jgi:hypothetical protein
VSAAGVCEEAEEGARMKKQRATRDAVTLSVRLDRDVVRALNVYAAKRDEYVYRVLDEFIREGLQRSGHSVEEFQ